MLVLYHLLNGTQKIWKLQINQLPLNYEQL
jgi:hypothetical protein